MGPRVTTSDRLVIRPKRSDLETVLEALRSAYTEIEAIEADSDFYVPSGRLMDQLEDARAIIEKYLEVE